MALFTPLLICWGQNRPQHFWTGRGASRFSTVHDRSHEGERTPFIERPIYRVGDKLVNANYRSPHIEKTGGEREEELIIYFRLVKMGMGDFFTVQKMTAREVVQALYYEQFLSDYGAAYIELNKTKA